MRCCWLCTSMSSGRLRKKKPSSATGTRLHSRIRLKLFSRHYKVYNQTKLLRMILQWRWPSMGTLAKYQRNYHSRDNLWVRRTTSGMGMYHSMLLKGKYMYSPSQQNLSILWSSLGSRTRQYVKSGPDTSKRLLHIPKAPCSVLGMFLNIISNFLVKGIRSVTNPHLAHNASQKDMSMYCRCSSCRWMKTTKPKGSSLSYREWKNWQKCLIQSNNYTYQIWFNHKNPNFVLNN